SRAAVQQAQAALDAARAQQAEAVIYAPRDGTVSAKSASVGTLVGPQAPILTLLGDGVEVTVPVEEARIASLQVGQAVSLSAVAYPGETIAGTVSTVSPAGDPRSRSFLVRIRPTEPNGKLKPGMSV